MDFEEIAWRVIAKLAALVGSLLLTIAACVGIVIYPEHRVGIAWGYGLATGAIFLEMTFLWYKDED